MIESNNAGDCRDELACAEQQMQEAISKCEKHINTIAAIKQPLAKIALAPIKHTRGSDDSQLKPDREAFEALGIFRAVKKRTRSVLSPLQHSILQREFGKEPFPNKVKREALGRSIGCSQRTVQIWFQNQRQKNRQTGHTMKAGGSMTTPSHPSRSTPLYTMPMAMPMNGTMMYPSHFMSSPPSPSLSYEGDEIFEGLNALVDVAMTELAHLTPKDPRLSRPTLNDLVKVAPPSLKSINFLDDRIPNQPSMPFPQQSNETERERIFS